MPLVPMLMPSEMVIVLKLTALPPASLAPLVACTANSSICMLQGVKSLPVEAIPICGFSKSSSSKPTALSMERAGARSLPSTTMDEKGRLQAVLSELKVFRVI